jgi:hypothetical protein
LSAGLSALLHNLPRRLATSVPGTLLPRANAAACPQLAKADFASSSQHVRERQRIAALDDMLVETLWPVALALLLGRRGRRTYGF